MLRSASLGRPLECARHAPLRPKPRAAGQSPKGRVARLVVDDKYTLKPTGDGDTAHLNNIEVDLPGEIELTEQVYQIGREDADIILPFPTVSGRHAELRVGPDSVEVTDLDSTNGTYLDGEECPTEVAKAVPVGSEIVFGDVHLASFKLTQA